MFLTLPRYRTREEPAGGWVITCKYYSRGTCSMEERPPPPSTLYRCIFPRSSSHGGAQPAGPRGPGDHARQRGSNAFNNSYQFIYIGALVALSLRNPAMTSVIHQGQQITHAGKWKVKLQIRGLPLTIYLHFQFFKLMKYREHILPDHGREGGGKLRVITSAVRGRSLLWLVIPRYDYTQKLSGDHFSKCVRSGRWLEGGERLRVRRQSRRSVNEFW